MASFSDQFAARVHAAERTIRILWVALMASVGMYGLVMFIVANEREPSDPAPELLAYVLPVLALSSAGAGAGLYRFFTSTDQVRALLQRDSSLVEAQGLPDAERRLSRVPPMLFTASIIRWALFESVAVFGLVLGILNHSLPHFLPYGVAALVLLALTPPRIKQQVDEAIALLPSS